MTADTDYSEIKFIVQLDHDVYDNVERLLATHIDFSNFSGTKLRAIIISAANMLKMDIPEFTGKKD